MQQPSPEGSLSLSSGITNAGGVAQGIDTLSGGDSEFDLDTLWDCWHNGSNVPTAVPQHPNAFGSYGLGHSQVHLAGPSVMYHPSDFR